MKYDDRKAVENEHGGWDFVVVESIIDEVRSDCSEKQCDMIQEYIDDYRDKIEELEDRVEELENILTDNDIEY